MIATLVAAGARRAYGLHGGPLLPVLEALVSGGPELVLVKHEASAVFAADGEARVTGLPSLVVVTSGPGTTNTVTATAAALRDGVPVFIIGAGTPASRSGMGAAQDLDTVALMATVTKEARLVTCSESAVRLAEHLWRVMESHPRGPVFLCLPADVAALPWPQNRGMSRPEPRGRAIGPARPVPAPETIELAARALSDARRPVILAGYGAVASGAGEVLRGLAEKLGSPVASTPRAKGVFPESHPLSLGPFGLAGSALADRVIGDEADVLLCVGTRLGEVSTAGWTPRLARPSMIRLDLDPTSIDLNYRSAVALVGDARATLAAIAGRVHATMAASRAPAGPGRSAEESRIAFGGRAPWLVGSTQPARNCLSPADAMAAVDAVLAKRPQDEIFADIGSVMLYATGGLVLDRPRLHVNWTFGSMGHATPAAIGAACATRRRTWALVGDAAFAQTGFEMHTACERRLPVVVVAFNNGGNAMCETGARLMGAKAPPAMFDRRIDIAGIARRLGARARVVRSLPRLRRALTWAATSESRPVVLDVHVDPDAIPPMGPRLRALSFAKGLTSNPSAGRR